ncbi:MAG: type III pantothenate kinase [Fusobacteriota bacterium]
MILGIDIGNTQIVTGIFSDSGELVLNFRVSSDKNLTEDQYFSYLKNIADFNNIKVENLEGIVIGSVVPNLTTVMTYLSHKYFNLQPLIISSELKLPINFAKDLDNPKDLGADRLMDIVQASILYPNKNLLVIDFGTATTFDVIKNNIYEGGVILPGINLSINALFQNTAKLPKIRFTETDSPIGKNTVEHINAGIYYGSIGQVKEIISQIKKEIPNLYVISTGGLAEMISKKVKDISEYKPQLTLDGLYSIYKYNRL